MPSPKADIANAALAAATANAAVIKADQDVAQLRQIIANLDEKAAPLHDQVAELSQQEPMQIGPDPAHVEALLSDPAAKPDQDAITSAISTARKQEDVRQMTIATVRAAIAKIDDERAAVNASIAEASEQRAQLWRDFAQAAGEYLALMFKKEFVRLRDEVLAPLIALAHIRDEHGQIVLPNGSTLATLSVDRGALAMRKYEPASGGGGSWNEEKLFQEARYVDAREAAAAVEQFRSKLPAVDLGADKFT